MASKMLSHKDYAIGWICALPVELAAAKLMLDQVHPKLPQPPYDQDSYVLGEIAGHNVTIACLSIYGVTSATAVVQQMRSTFHNIRFGLMVGIGGGVPSLVADIRLGDVVVSKPTGQAPGIVQYDFGKTTPTRHLRVGTQNMPP